MAITLISAAALIAVENGMFPAKRAPQLIFADTVSMYIWKDAEFDDVVPACDAWWPPSARVGRAGHDSVMPAKSFDAICVQGVYSLNYEAGPTWARDLIGSENFSVRPLPYQSRHDSINRAPTAAETERLNDRALAVLLKQLKTAGIRPGVKPIGPGRTWVNWNEAITLVAWPALLVSLAVALIVFVIDRIVGSRRRCVASGLCPGCHYNIRGCTARTCPECNEAFTDYERTIIEAMLPLRPPASSGV